ncbi:LOW QUALITY PROTEIN: transmembrane protein 115 [Procambarus clarkii]|uniref:LOW QUALITY PROTEIN: transmembrane protein 115 n=1 Tax=Procambarus clarkii TaxID=6728 RepID=UPI001E677EF6|nr:transmembrane protein 115-like [Procambarus clarkii]
MASASVVLRNLPVIKQSLIAIIGNTGLFVKFVCVLLIIGYGLSFSESAVTVLSVTPGYLLPPTFWLWTAFTHCFLEVRLWQVCADLVTLGLCGKLIEPLWGSFEMVLFFLLVNVCVAFISALFYLIIYMCTFNPEVLFSVQINGMAGYVAGLSVAVKQIMPDHVLLHTRTPLGKISNRHVPLCLFLTALLLYLCNLLEGLYTTMIGCGIAVSWVYLRFYQIHSNGTRGDMAETFAFSCFFPTVLQPPIQVVGDSVYSCLVRIKVCRRPVRRYDVGAPSSIAISLPGMDPHDAERRRQKALRLLSARLNQDKSGEGGGAWPTLDDSPGSRTQSPQPSSHPPSTHTTPLPPKSGKSVTIALPPESSELPSTKPSLPASSSSSLPSNNSSSLPSNNSSVATATLVTIEKESSADT